MNHKAYKALEYSKIIHMLTDKASSSMGKDICRKTEPSTDIEKSAICRLRPGTL